MPTVTLETSAPCRYWHVHDRDRCAGVKRLLSLTERGRLDLVVTARIKSDIPRPPLADRIEELPELNIRQIGAVFRPNVSALGSRDGLGSDQFVDVMKTIEDKLDLQGIRNSRPDRRDWDHSKATTLHAGTSFSPGTVRFLRLHPICGKTRV